MHSGALTTMLSVGSAALVTLVLAYMIGARGRTGLISGHKQGTARDEQGLARWVGGWLAALGLCLLVFAAVFPFLVGPGQVRSWAIGLVVACVICSIPLTAGMQRCR